jgi:outer membrane protein OmpA-like peptidoglycan-associated protein
VNSNISVGSDAVVVGTYTDYSSAENLGAGSTYKGNGREIDPRSVISSTVNVGRESSSNTTVISSEETAIFDEALYGIQFETGSANITSSSSSILTKVYNVMRNKSSINFEIGGHTDNVGNSAANQRLSEARAKSVYNYLIKRGIAASRLTFVGYGDTNPVADNGTAAGKAKNRRVQFTIR